MRLAAQTVDAIKVAFKEVFVQGDIYLFGSRVDDNARGGDIDLYLIIEEQSRLFEKKIKYLAKVKHTIGDQRIDLVFNQDPERSIEQEAKRWGIKL